MSGRFSIVSHALRSTVEKPKNKGFLVENSQQIPHQSRTVSPIDLGNGALDARDRVEGDAALCVRLLTTAASVLGEN